MEPASSTQAPAPSRHRVATPEDIAVVYSSIDMAEGEVVTKGECTADILSQQDYALSELKSAMSEMKSKEVTFMRLEELVAKCSVHVDDLVAHQRQLRYFISQMTFE